MTTSQMILIASLYLAAFAVVVYFTRAKTRRSLGALCGGAVFGVVGILAIELGEFEGWWRVPTAGSSHLQLLLWLSIAISASPIYLITWRVARRFGGRGLIVCTLIAAVIGPPRDYLVAKVFPEWITHSPGIAPILAIAAIYALMIVVGNGVMRVVAGHAQGDLLARQNIGERKIRPAGNTP